MSEALLQNIALFLALMATCAATHQGVIFGEMVGSVAVMAMVVIIAKRECGGGK